MAPRLLEVLLVPWDTLNSSLAVRRRSSNYLAGREAIGPNKGQRVALAGTNLPVVTAVIRFRGNRPLFRDPGPPLRCRVTDIENLSSTRVYGGKR